MKVEDAKEVAFMGRITAGFTHEMKNVLAIIKESAGLMEDLLSLTPEGSFPQRARLFGVLTKILEQVRRGVDLSSRLNRFAHSSDEAVATVDLNAMAEQVAVLAERFARLKGVTLKAEPAAEKLLVSTSPVGLVMAVFCGLESCWDCMKSGCELKIAGEGRGDEMALHLLPQGDFGDVGEFASGVTGSEKWESFEKMVSSLEGRVEWRADKAGFAMVFPRGSVR
jgi:hypothetical protein